MSDVREPDDLDFAEAFRREYLRTPLPEPEAQARIVAAARRGGRPGRGILDLAAWLEPRTIAVRPVMAVALAIALIGAGALLARIGLPQRSPVKGTRLPPASARMYTVQFMLVAPSANRVALVGDFNGWDAAATPMRHRAGRDTWTVTVPVASGWHAYAFVVDGARWIHDPRAPLAPPDEFGGPRSVVVVGEHGEGT